MKRFWKCTLLFVLVFLVFVTPFAGSGYSENAIAYTEKETTTMEDVHLSTLSEQYDFFVYEIGVNYYWSSANSDLGNCVSDYLYARNPKTEEITLFWNQPVSDYVQLGSKLLVTCVGENTIFEITAPLIATEFYKGENETVDRLVYTDDYLFFVDGNILKMYDRASESFSSLCVCEDIQRLAVRSYDNTVFWCNSKDEYYTYSVFEKTQMPIDYEDVYIGRPLTTLEENVDKDGQGTRNGLASFPLSDYPVGSYFSRNGKQCSATYGCVGNHKCSESGTCNCKKYKGAIQCMGFAEYAADQYAHSPNFDWRADGGDKNEKQITLSDAADAQSYFEGRNVGDYLRVRGNASSGHSIVIAGKSSNGITIYEGNYGGYCRVNMREMTYAEFYEDYAVIVCVVSHSFDGMSIKYSSVYHKVTCSTTNCDGYILIRHYAANVGSPTRCAACGYIGNFSEGLA